MIKKCCDNCNNLGNDDVCIKNNNSKCSEWELSIKLFEDLFIENKNSSNPIIKDYINNLSSKYSYDEFLNELMY